MKICYINPTVLLKRPIAEIIDILGKKHKLSLLIPQKKRLDSSMHYSDVKKAKIISYKTIQPLIASEFPIPCPTLLLIRSWKLLKNNDVIHMWVPFYLSTSFTPILKRLFFKKKKLILTMDTIPAYSFSMGPFMDILFKIYYKTLGKIVFSCVDQITLYGKSLIPYAKKAGLPLKKVKITPTGIKQRTNPVTKVIRREFNIKKDEKIALFVGIINPRKGVDTVIKVAKKLKNQNIKFIIVGDGPA